MRCFGNPMDVFGFVLCDILYYIVESLSLIHGRKSNHVKTLCTICVIILYLCS